MTKGSEGARDKSAEVKSSERAHRWFLQFEGTLRMSAVTHRYDADAEGEPTRGRLRNALSQPARGVTKKQEEGRRDDGHSIRHELKGEKRQYPWRQRGPTRRNDAENNWVCPSCQKGGGCHS